MTKENLQTRLKQLEEARITTMANLNAIIGAIQECTYWLDTLNKAESSDKSPE